MLLLIANRDMVTTQTTLTRVLSFQNEQLRGYRKTNRTELQRTFEMYNSKRTVDMCVPCIVDGCERQTEIGQRIFFKCLFSFIIEMWNVFSVFPYTNLLKTFVCNVGVGIQYLMMVKGNFNNEYQTLYTARPLS